MRCLVNLMISKGRSAKSRGSDWHGQGRSPPPPIKLAGMRYSKMSLDSFQVHQALTTHQANEPQHHQPRNHSVKIQMAGCAGCILHRRRQSPLVIRLRGSHFHKCELGERREHHHCLKRLPFLGGVHQLRRDHLPCRQCVQWPPQSYHILGLPRSQHVHVHIHLLRPLCSGLRPVSVREKVVLGEIRSGSQISHST
jgi:hypothetical protein